MRYRHIKTQGEYEVIGSARMQTNESTILDMAIMVIYKSLKDNSVWVRPYHEFHDGRFELINLINDSNEIPMVTKMRTIE